MITGGIVLASCLVLWNLTYRFQLDGLDRDMLRIAQANLQRVYGRSHWERLDESLSFQAKDDESALSFRIWMQLRGRYGYVSSAWPEALDPTEQFRNWDALQESMDAPPLPDKGQPIASENPALAVVASSFSDEYVDGARWRLGMFDNYYGSLAIAVDIDSFDARMDGLKRRYYWVAPLALLFAFSGAWLVASRSLKPVKDLTAAVEGLSAQGLDQRLEEDVQEKEFRRLVRIYNDMLARLETSFEQARRFSADASHELKTPLARLQMELEVAHKEAKTGSKEQATYSNILDELRRLNGIVEKLTLLSLSDAGRLQLGLEEISLNEMLANVVEDCNALTGGERIHLRAEAECVVPADPVLLEQAVQNLCGNALRYGWEDGTVEVSLARGRDGKCRLRVANEGPAIPKEEWERIFDRFYRRDAHHRSRQQGAGLGLSLTREIIKAHGGELALLRSDGDWTVFEVVL
ncbi:ATP-binding protein [Pelagicoccus sp. SDUM812005]|uniref:ATP-binding protein n=1 Tax=Pelagicoccus sp. SDUM812005 TaxID=3041257 RepID=UPI0028117A92|nr:ATP-binding protein [Pelagicoccus sp. SDUM812005]